MTTSTRPMRTTALARIAPIAGSFAGISLLFISTLVGQASALDLSLRISLYCFAGSLPLAALAIVVVYKWPDGRSYTYPFLLAAIGATSGIGAVLWHLDIVASVVYIVAVVLSIGFWLFCGPVDKDAQQPH